MKVKVYYNKEKDRYLHTILKNGEVEVVRRPEYAKYWDIDALYRMWNFRSYHKLWGETLKALGFLPIDVTIVVVEE